MSASWSGTRSLADDLIFQDGPSPRSPHNPACEIDFGSSSVNALARQLPILATGVRGGHDIPAAARHAACVDANLHARRRLRRWADAVESGESATVSARRLGFPTAFVACLSCAAGSDALGASLDYMSGYYRRLLIHWQQILFSLLMPLVVCFWAALIGYVVVALYLPLQSLTEHVMDST